MSYHFFKSFSNKVVLTIVVLLAFLTIAKSQSNVAFTKPITSSNLNSATIDFEDYLEDGKYVLIDFFTTWCGPCWNAHNNGYLNDIHASYGPNSDEYVVNVVGIEISGRTNNYDLNHETEESYGDWLDGTSYPIFDLKSGMDIDLFSGAYFVNSYPTYILLCPDGGWYEINGGSQAMAHVEAIVDGTISCPNTVEDDPALLSVIGNKYSCVDSFDLGIIHTNFGSGPPLTQEFLLSVTTEENEVIIIDTLLVESLVNEGELDTSFFTLSDIYDNAKYKMEVLADSFTYTRSSVYFRPKEFSYSIDTSFVYDTDSLFSNVQETERLYAFIYNRLLSKNVYQDMPLELIFGKFSFENVEAVDLEITFSQASGDSNQYNKLEFIYSEDCGVTWNTTYSIKNEELHTFDGECEDDPVFKSIKIDLDDLSYLEDVLIGLRYHSGTDCRIEFEDIDFVNDSSTNIESPGFNDFSIYPIPVNQTLTIESSQSGQKTISVRDVLGAEIQCVIMDSAELKLDVSHFSDGFYFIHIEGIPQAYKFVKR